MLRYVSVRRGMHLDDPSEAIWFAPDVSRERPHSIYTILYRGLSRKADIFSNVEVDRQRFNSYRWYVAS